MSITSIDFNYNCNGGSHTASVSEAVGAKRPCGALGSSANAQINGLLSEFELDSTTTKKTSAGTFITKNYIDRASSILDSYVIVVRGITAPTMGGLKYEGIVYPSSELPSASLTTAFGRNVGQRKATGSGMQKNGKVIILGSVYSVIAVQDGGDRIFKIYNRENLLENAKYSPYEQQVSASLGNPIDITAKLADKAIQKYGYTITEFLNALSTVGLTVTGAPSSNGKLILFDNSGTLRDCISAIASYYGYFWYSVGYKIVFVNSAHANSMAVPDYTKSSADNIVESSYTSGGATSGIIGSFFGKEEQTQNSSSSSQIPLGQEPSFTEVFRAVDFSKLMSSDSIKFFAAFTLFMAYGPKNSNDIFDKLIYNALLDTKISDHPLFKKLYDSTLNDDAKKKFSDLLNTSQIKEAKNKQSRIDYERGSCYSLMSSNQIDVIEKPSGSTLLTAITSFYNLYGCVYMSKGISKSSGEKIDLTSNQLNIEGPISGETKIADTESLSDLAAFLKTVQVKGDFTVANLVAMSQQTSSTSTTITGSDNYYIGILKEKRFPKKNDELNPESIFDFLQKNCVVPDWGDNKIWFAINKADEKKAAKIFTDSQALFLKYKPKSYIEVIGKRVKEDPHTVDINNDSDSFRPFSWEFCEIKNPTGGNNKSELSVYNGSPESAKQMAELFHASNSAQNAMKSSSVTFNGIVIPERNVLVDGISFSFGSDGATTTISYSTKAFFAPDKSLLIAGGGLTKTISDLKQNLRASAKNFLGIH